MEIWKDVKGYEGIYQVSSLGRIKSLKRKVYYKNGRIDVKKEKILKATKNTSGYLSVDLCKNTIKKRRTVHQLVAIAFLNHNPCGHKLVVNHININKTDNRIDNLEIVTTRENSNRKHLKSTSKYTGVSWNKLHNKWIAHIGLNGKTVHLGVFSDEYEAHLAYEKKLNSITV